MAHWLGKCSGSNSRASQPLCGCAAGRGRGGQSGGCGMCWLEVLKRRCCKAVVRMGGIVHNTNAVKEKRKRLQKTLVMCGDKRRQDTRLCCTSKRGDVAVLLGVLFAFANGYFQPDYAHCIAYSHKRHKSPTIYPFWQQAKIFPSARL